MSFEDRKDLLTDTVKAAVVDSGVLDKLKTNAPKESLKRIADQQTLQPQAKAAISDIQEILSNSRNDRVSAKLMGMLVKLESALEQGTLSQSSIAAALSAASSAIASTDENMGAEHLTPQQAKEKLWLQIEVKNKEINDDFEKMRHAGIHFNDGLWNRHKQLTEELATHPHDVKKQKELDAVDDAMLMQAEKQLDKSPGAKSFFEDATKKSKDRHQLVDKDLVAIDKAISKADGMAKAFDDNSQSSDKAQSGQLTMDDVKSQSVGLKPKLAAKQQI